MEQRTNAFNKEFNVLQSTEMDTEQEPATKTLQATFKPSSLQTEKLQG